MIVARTGRTVKMTATGEVIGRDSVLLGFSIHPAGSDLSVTFTDGHGQQLYSAEADAGAGSHAEHFQVGIRFRKSMSVTFSQAVDNQAVWVLLDEPTER